MIEEQPSGKLYTVVTKYWPRIAAGLVIVIGLVEFVVGGLTADSGLEFYLLAWAATTGGLWFVFEKVETAISSSARQQSIDWLSGTDPTVSISAIPDQFAGLFDHLFGRRHLSLRCFLMGASASVLSVSVVAMCYTAFKSEEILTALAAWEIEGIEASVFFLMFVIQSYTLSALYNVLPDYVSLLETRWLIGLMKRGRVLIWVGVDLVLTAALSASAVAGVATVMGVEYESLGRLLMEMLTFQGNTITMMDGLPVEINVLSVFFYSAFFTSVWLWLYAASVYLSRILLRMNNGVGFLLRVTDVEKQPFRSMGFVSVIIVSALFALGLPLVLL